MEKIITSKVRKNLDEHTARFILEQVSLKESCTLEQLRKSMDRNYTMTGFILTVFMAITAFIASMPSSRLLLALALPLCIGTGIALVILFCKVISVHHFMPQGIEASSFANEKTIDVALSLGLQDKAKANDVLRFHFLINAIERSNKNTEYNRKCLYDRCRYVKMASTTILVSVIISTMMAVAFPLTMLW